MRVRKLRWRASLGGFSLIEMMMGVVILVVSICAAISSQVIAHNLLRTSRETDAAMGDLEGAMELAILQSPQSLPIAGSEFANGTAIPRFNGLHLRNETITATYPGYVVGAAVPDPLQVVMTIQWNDYLLRPRTLRLATMRTR
jgi:prepilin-type N-terminal cleavage/methylation domain-containing protein